MTILSLSLSTLLLVTTSSFAQTCPPPTTAVDPQISSQVTLNKQTGKYTYSYTASNGKGAAISLTHIRLVTPSSPLEIKNPMHWSGEFIELEHIPPNISWMAEWQPSDLPKSFPENQPSPTLEKIASAIKPGASLKGFGLTSSQAPGIVQWFAEGFSNPPVVKSENEAEASSNCPGWSDENPIVKSYVNGMAIGPSMPGVKSIRIRLRDESGKSRGKPFDQKDMKGKVTVLVLSSKDFDPEGIDIETIRFGRQEIAPISTQLVPLDRQDTQAGEEESWEQFHQASFQDKDRQKKKNLLLVFDKEALDVQCALDRALFLNAEMKDGSEIVGGVTTRTVGCDYKRPGMHKKFKPRLKKKKGMVH